MTDTPAPVGPPQPLATKVVLVDPRRLTGPNILVWRPLVLVELAFGPEIPVAGVVSAYGEELARMRAELHWQPDVPELVVRPHAGGAVIGYDAPLDLMLAATEMNEWAAWSVGELYEGRPNLPLEPTIDRVREMVAKDESLNMRALEAEARKRDVPFLWDDDAVSVGLGVHSITWPRDGVPPITEVNWDKVGKIPVALITGTNGKTTTTRLLAKIAREAGKKVGMSSSDTVTIGTKVVEEGDWTGPAAARMVLRSHEVDFAVLETARGGILRRGLAVDEADAAIITNVSEDHSGYGIDDLDQMAQVKAVTVRAVKKNGTVVLNAHDRRLVELAPTLEGAVTLFADLDREDAGAQQAIDRHKGKTVVAKNGVVRIGDTDVKLAELPITFKGAARHNIENVLGVTAMALGLGLPTDAIIAGLRNFGSADNPRRGEVHEVNGVKIILDFAHNPAGVRTLLSIVSALRGNGNLIVIAGSAGDRRDEEILGMCDELAVAKPSYVLIRELADYMRGREVGEVANVFKRGLKKHGLTDAQLEVVDSEVAALVRSVEIAKPGDIVIMLVHLDDAPVHQYLTSIGATFA